MTYTVAAVDKALTILEHLAEAGELGVTELAELTSSTKSQIFRLLYTLEGRGFVRKNEASRRYALGYRTLYVGDKTKHQMDLIRLAQPYLDELAELSKENVHLLVRDGVHGVCIALSESPQPLRLSAQVGNLAPLHVGGATSVLLAYAPPEIQKEVLEGELEVFTNATVTDRKKLTERIAAIRQAGSYESLNDLDEGAFSIAAPIHDHQDNVVAALSIAGPVSRLSEKARVYHRELVVNYSGRISQALGSSPHSN